MLPGVNIIKPLDIAACFGIDRFKVGQGEWEMMTSNEKRLWVFPLSPPDFDYAKLDEYFGKLRQSEIEALKMQGDFGEHLDVGESREKKIQD